MLRHVWWLALLLGCRSVPGLIDASTGSGGDDDRDDGGTVPTHDAGEALSDDGDGPIMRRSCVSTFGDALYAQPTFGRLDGYLIAIVPPQSSSRPCNADLTHVHLQILMQDQVYDIAVNVGTDVHSTTIDHAPFSAWADGWHTGSDVYVEYTGLGLHANTIPLTTPTELTAAITADLANTNRISIYATTYGSDGAHLVHRNGGGSDGLIVTKPLAGTAHMRAFSFDGQSF